jgi:hypothetical protein
LEELFVSCLAQIDALAEVVDCEGADQFCHSFFPVFCDFKVGGFVNAATGFTQRGFSPFNGLRDIPIASYTIVPKIQLSFSLPVGISTTV